jgi:enamine deaminase RidA (YjgF/YER057c/UK114 family)
MNLTTHKKFKGDRLMPWGKATVVTGAKGYVFLSGNTATTDDYDPSRHGGGAAGDPAMQWRAILANIKFDLEEAGSSLEHLVKLTFYVKGPFPTGGVLSSPGGARPSSLQHRQVEPVEPILVGHHLDAGDPPVPDREAEHQEQPSAWRHHRAYGAIDQRGAGAAGASEE